MKTLFLSLGFVLVSIIALAVVPTNALAAGSKPFSDKSVKGCYGFEFHGTAVHGTVGAPIAASGRFCADGKGNMTELTRVLHIPGSVLHQNATGVYTVSPDGTGQATFDVMMNGMPFSQETFHSVITEKGKTLQFVSGTVAGPGGASTGSDTLISGTARRQ